MVDGRRGEGPMARTERVAGHLAARYRFAVRHGTERGGKAVSLRDRDNQPLCGRRDASWKGRERPNEAGTD
jgi:hypothetical protein